MFIYNRVNENFNNAGAHHKLTHLYASLSPDSCYLRTFLCAFTLLVQFAEQ